MPFTITMERVTRVLPDLLARQTQGTNAPQGSDATQEFLKLLQDPFGGQVNLPDLDLPKLFWESAKFCFYSSSK